MYELRRISHKCKPVSRHDQRDALEALLQRRSELVSRCETTQEDLACAVKNATLTTAGRENCTGTDADVENDSERSFRPESVVIEVRGLFEQRPVSSLLESTFRSSLERALRQTERQRRRRSRPTPAPRRRGGPAPQLATNGRARARSPRSARRTASRPVHRPANGSPPAPDGLQEHVEQMQRNEALVEINELLQQQVVTHLLAGEFHGVLEVHLRVGRFMITFNPPPLVLPPPPPPQKGSSIRAKGKTS